MSFIPFIQENKKDELLFDDLNCGDIFTCKDGIFDEDIQLYIVTNSRYYDELGDKFNAVDLDGCLVHFSSDEAVALYVGNINLPLDPNKFKTTKEIM